MNSENFSHLFPLGSHLCREPMPPMPELKKDMETLKRHGFNLVKLQEHWMIDEPREGQVDFSKYEELIDYAARLDMGVYLGLTCEQAPSWLWQKYPGCRMVRRDGLPVAYQAQYTLPADGKPGPCYDHPGAMADHLRFIRRLVERLGRYENLVVWNTWQEVAYWPDRLAGGHVCYCENTLDHFRRWLADRYGDLDRLNLAWNSRYADWDSISPDRCATGRECLPSDVDWFYFMDNVQIAQVLKARAQAIREADPLKRPVFAHLAGPVTGSGRHWNYARCQDFLGCSCYPAWSPFHPWDDRPQPLDRHSALLAEMWNGVALSYDQVRSCNPPGSPVWAAEFQGGPVSTGFHKGRVPSPQDIRRWMLTAVASGVTALSYWVTRAEIGAPEMNGFSLLDSEGDRTPRFEEASRIGRALNAHAGLFGQPTLLRAPAAILVDEWNFQFCASMVQGGDSLGYSTRGWHRLLWEAGIPVDFLVASELEEDYARQYQALILPFPISISEETAGKLARYVEKGGNLISEACPGRINEHAYANRGELSPALRELFGVRQTGLAMVREPGGETRWSPRERTWGEFLEPALLRGTGPLAGQRVRANLYIETFQCARSEPFLLYGESIAGVVRQVGERGGRAWLFGTYIGHNGTAYSEAESQAFVRRLLERCGVTPAHPGRLLLRKRVLPGKEAWIFTNPTGQDLAESVDVSGWAQVEDLLGEPVERDGDCIHLAVKSLDIRVLLLGTQQGMLSGKNEKYPG